MSKNLSFNISIITIIIIIAVIITSSCIKTNKKHKEKMFNSTVRKIEEKALKCYNEEVCPNNKIYLKELYDNSYLEREVNPLNNEYINDESYVIIDDNEASLTIID